MESRYFRKSPGLNYSFWLIFHFVLLPVNLQIAGIFFEKYGTPFWLSLTGSTAHLLLLTFISLLLRQIFHKWFEKRKIYDRLFYLTVGSIAALYIINYDMDIII